MIERANDPNASRAAWRVESQSVKTTAAGLQRGRAGHAWPFLSRHVERPRGVDTGKNPRNESGS
ncbi:hypothetical protein WG922_16450 [Ramlibacter sp. AN1015]|uniref:hypothetical protein n=1 Tax=Ramlibacter sp. AN1015 TaxID=3133428 RepID=UPI0030BE8360